MCGSRVKIFVFVIHMTECVLAFIKSNTETLYNMPRRAWKLVKKNF